MNNINDEFKVGYQFPFFCLKTDHGKKRFEEMKEWAKNHGCTVNAKYGVSMKGKEGTIMTYNVYEICKAHIKGN